MIKSALVAIFALLFLGCSEVCHDGKATLADTNTTIIQDITDINTTDSNITTIDENATIPTLIDTKLAILEDANGGDIVGRVTIADDGKDTIASMLLSGDGKDNFECDNEGVVRVSTNNALNFDILQEYNLSVIATNSIGDSPSVSLIIYLNNIFDEQPILLNSFGTVEENATIGTVVGDINISSIGDSSITNIILSGENSEYFTITKDGNISLKLNSVLDFETKPLFDFIVVATNLAGSSNEAGLSINIIDTPEIALLADTNLSIVENEVAGATVGKLTIVHSGDAPITLITLSGDGNESFNIATDGVVTLSENTAIDFETKPLYKLSAIATNDAGDTLSVRLNIAILDYEYDPFQIAKVLAYDGEKEDRFGSSVAMSGEFIVVGSPSEDVDGVLNSGAVYLYKKSNGSVKLISKIQADDKEANDNFGSSVAMDENIIVVGSPNEDENNEDAGSIYLYTLLDDMNITSPQKLQSSNSKIEKNFGSSVALDDSFMVVGAESSAYLFSLSGSTASQVDTIKPTDIELVSDVDIDNNNIIIGASHNDEKATDAGEIYLYTIANNKAVHTSRATANDAEDGDFFGVSVGISGDFVIVGAYKEDTIASNAGSAYLFKIQNSSLVQKAKLQAPHSEVGANFGYKVDIDKRIVAVGAYTNSSAYVYDIALDDSVKLISKLQASDGEVEDYFASSIALSGDYIAVGAFEEDSNGEDAGSIYVYDGEPIQQIYIYNAQDSIVSLDEEIQADILNIDAKSPNGVLSYSLSGEDASNFSLDDSIISNRAKFNYESPVDTTQNNRYNAKITLRDDTGYSKELDLKLSIVDKYYLNIATNYADDARVDDRFGCSISMSGDYIAVGSSHNDGTINDGGAVYLFKKLSDGSISKIIKFSANDTAMGDYFGNSVALDGEFLVVGAYKKDSKGAIYLFKIASDDSVSQLSMIQPSDIASDDNFGEVVAMSDNYVVASSPQKDTQTGAVYAFKIDNYNIGQIKKLSASDASNDSKFGSSLDIDNEFIIINNYLFKIALDDNITQIQKLVLTGSVSSVSIDAKFIALGVEQENSAYLFKITSNSVSKIADIHPSDTTSNSFGETISISQSDIVVGSLSKFYIYRKNADNTVDELDSFQTATTSMSIYNNQIVIGNTNDSTKGSNAGVFMFYVKDE